MQKTVSKTNGGVTISFKEGVQKQQIMNMVQNCATGQCECMNEETKKKITNMEVNGVDNDVSLKLSGDITTQEIKQALENSKALNG